MASCTSETEPMSSASASSAATASSTSCSAIASGCSTARMASPIAAAIAEPETGEATQQRYRRQRHRVREADDGRAAANTARGGRPREVVPSDEMANPRFPVPTEKAAKPTAKSRAVRTELFITCAKIEIFRH